MNLKGKGSQAKNRYNRELESYKWFVVNLKENKAITGYEFKSDALDVLSDYDDSSRYKVVSEISLKKLGIENPKEMWKYKMAKGGGVDDDFADLYGGEVFLLSKGYSNPMEVYFQVEDRIFEVTQAQKGLKNIGIFYYTENFENQIDKQILDKISSDFGNEFTVTLYTNAGVDLHSSSKGKYKNIQVERLKGNYSDGGGIGFRNIDKIKSHIGESVFNHINSLNKKELEKQLSELRNELKITDKESSRYFKLKDEEWFILYRLERSSEYEFADGGGIDLFEDYDNIPANVQKVLDKYEDAFMDGDYEGLREAKKEVNKIGYTFNFDMDGTAYGLKPLNKMAKGGGVGNENALMVANNNKQIYHHTKEMSEALKGTKNVPAWVVAKVNRSASDLSDATHYLEGAEGMYADGGGVEDNLNKKYLNSIPEDKKQRILRNVADHYGISIKDAEKEVTDIESEALYEYITNESLRMEVYNGMENRKFSDIGELENLTPVELYFRNLDYSKLPESFSNFIKTEILTDPELKYLSEREPIFIEIKEKVEKYENQNSGKVEEAEEESIGDLIAGLEVLVPISTKKEKKELLDLIEGLKLLL